MNVQTYPVSRQREVIKASYEAEEPGETHPYILDISIDPVGGLEYSRLESYSSRCQRDIAYCSFQQEEADAFCQKALVAVEETVDPFAW